MTTNFTIDVKMERPLVMLFPHEPSKETAEDLRRVARDLHTLANQYDPKENVIRIIKKDKS